MSAKSFKRFLRFASLFILFLPLRGLPRPAGRGFGALLGSCSWWLLPRLRRRALRNLALAYPAWPERRRERVARDVLRWIGRTGADFLRLGAPERSRLLAAVRAEGVEHWRQAVEQGRGVVVVTGHFGNWELLGAWLAAHGPPVHVVYHPFREERLDRFVRRLREAAGVRGIPETQGGFRALRALRRGEVVGVLVDRVPRGPSIECEFFGRRCRAAPGAAWLALRSRAPLVPVALWEDREGYRLRFEPALESAPARGARDVGPPARARPDAPRVAAVTRRLTAILEGWIREAPEQWPWFYDRWKIRSRRAGPAI
jgi:KDO2-lipid IV(A) lauroyltransferase